MKMSVAGVALALSLALPPFTTPAAAQPPRPNILLILADDLGYGDLGCYGCPDARTPNIDRLAREGVRLTSFYANGPECTPTRAALMTGRYQHRVGGLECAIGLGNVGRYDDAIRLAGRHDLGLPAAETSVARILRDAGYATALCGKWHLGYEDKFAPNRHGFDHAFYVLGGGVDYFHHCEAPNFHTLRLNGKPVRRDGYLTDRITDEALRVLREQRDRPLFLYVPYTAPHTPLQGPDDRAAEPVPPDDWNKGTRATYVRMVERLDAGVGRILAALDERGLAENTLVVFASDNGGTRTGRNAPLSGNKGTLYEGGIRVPCIVRRPGHIKPGTTDDRVAITMDLTASIVRAAGATPARAPVPGGGRAFDGIDVLADIGAGKPAAKRTLFWRARRGDRTEWAVRDGDLKYLRRKVGERTSEHLFDLAADIAEKRDLLAQRPQDAARLKRLLGEWEKEVRAGR